MLNCSDPECILHHHHYYHGHVQHHLQDDRAHHEHPTHHPMSGESDGIQDAVIQDYLNDTDSELSSLSHLDAPSESVYMICGVLIAMLLVGFIIILLAVTIRFKAPVRSVSCKCCQNFCKFSKLRKREENAVAHRSNVVHPEGVLQATIVGTGHDDPTCGKSSPLEDIFIAPVVSSSTSTSSLPCHHQHQQHQRKSLTASCHSSSDNSCSGYSSEATAQLPMFLYSTGNSRNSLNSVSTNDQDVLVHPYGPTEDFETNNNNHSTTNNNNTAAANNNNNSSSTGYKEEVAKKNIKGKLKKLVRRKSPPADNYALPMELREQLKQIYVY